MIFYSVVIFGSEKLVFFSSLVCTVISHIPIFRYLRKLRFNRCTRNFVYAYFYLQLQCYSMCSVLKQFPDFFLYRSKNNQISVAILSSMLSRYTSSEALHSDIGVYLNEVRLCLDFVCRRLPSFSFSLSSLRRLWGNFTVYRLSIVCLESRQY